jgi:hypothetical protein
MTKIEDIVSYRSHFVSNNRLVTTVMGDLRMELF